MEQEQTFFKRRRDWQIVWVIIASITLFFPSCKNETNKNKQSTDVLTYDSLPKGKWNGEYIRVKDDAEKKIKKKGNSSEFLHLGEVKLTLDQEIIDITLFEGKLNALSFNSSTINTLIKGTEGEEIQVYFKNNTTILTHYKGDYTADPEQNEKKGVKMIVRLGEKTYTLTKGNVQIIDFNPQGGIIEFSVKGEFSDTENSTIKGKGNVKMRFETSIRLAD
ncbi:MAG: hypothetical protein H3C31_10660 [Brumimicrobium sp.]|nr:hypothetical protein [Brumimicrobium sp.]